MSFSSKRDNFKRTNSLWKDMVQGHMAMDIEVALKTTAGMPVSNTKVSGNKRGGGGHMKSETRHFKADDGSWRVEIDKEYAGYQERGRRKDGSYVVRNYSTAGTSAGFFMRAIIAVLRNRSQYISEAKRALNL